MGETVVHFLLSSIIPVVLLLVPLGQLAKYARLGPAISLWSVVFSQSNATQGA